MNMQLEVEFKLFITIVMEINYIYKMRPTQIADPQLQFMAFPETDPAT